MGISNKSHGKKSDKETQSPVLKLFRDMMQKEKQDPEKTNLLKNKTKEEKKKKKHYSKTAVSTCSDRHSPPFKGNQELRKAEYDHARTKSFPFQEEKRESWWFWGEPNNDKPASEDTCSCVSCALKKLINTDYACVGCLVLIFIISVIVAFLLVYKSIPCLNDKSESEKVDNDRPKRKIDGLSRLRFDHLRKKSSGESKWGRDVGSYVVPNSMDSASKFQDLNHLDSDSDLFKIFNGDVMREIQSSGRLQEFYNKLIQTDARIRKLKKSDDFGLTSLDNIEDKYKTYPERAKRSLKIFHKPLQHLHFRSNKKEVNEIYKINNEKKRNIEDTKVLIAANKDIKLKSLNKTRIKKYVNATEPEGFVIENKRVLIQYKPKYINRKSKCSHAPKESKSHENQLKHPFYQNSQRLDELLDKFLDKNLPDIMTDEFGIDMVFGKEKKCKHPKIETEIKKSPDKIFIESDKAVTNTNEKLTNINNFKTDENDLTKILKSETNTLKNNVFANDGFDGNKKRDGSTTNAYGLLRSVTTMMYAGNNNFKRTTYSPLIDKVPNARKLLQTDTDDDMNEVMVHSAHDEPDNEDRKKRMNDLSSKVLNNKLNVNPASILNPNWKGPMPLYPDELSSMIKQEPIIVNRVETPVHRYNSEILEEPTSNKVESIERRKCASESDEKLISGVETPVNSGDFLLKSDKFETDLNDMEYIEDYFRNKYDRLVGLAQAYSDYGVLVDKKTNDEKVVDKAKLVVPDHRAKLSLGGIKKGFKNSVFGRPKKGSLVSSIPSEGFRLEIQPTTGSREDIPAELYKKLQKHIKVSNFKQTPFTKSNINAKEMDLVYRPLSEELTTEKFGDSSNGIIFAIRKGTRSLKSVELTDNDTLSEVPGDDGAIHSKRNIKNVFDSEHKAHKFEVVNFFIEDNVNNSAMELTTLDEFAKNSTNNVKKGERALSNNADRSLSDNFMLLANWFSVLDGLDGSVNQSLVRNSSFPDKMKQREFIKNETLEIIYPVHDSDMVENVGRRSRALLSTEDGNYTQVEHKNGNEEVVKVNEDVDLKVMNITKKLPVKTTENKTKSVVKRNAEDSNLIFWNDLYDDNEYGVQDHLENNVRNKHSVGNGFLKRPNEWFRDKVRKIADGFHKRGNTLKKEHEKGEVQGEAVKYEKAKNTNQNVVMKSKYKNNVHKRMSRDVKDNGVPKTDFSALAASMRKICRKAANDIAQANKVDAKATSKEGQATTTLMQQLTRLMSELVEYQVKQRTCRKLPPDLKKYLEWLTSPDPEPDSAVYSTGYQTEEYPEIDFGKLSDKLEGHTLDIAFSSEREERPDRVGTLQSVLELMRNYEDLTDDDKIKMAGVKEYLENKRQYLQKRMSPVYDMGFYNIDGLRFRRDITLSPQMKHKRRKRKFKHIVSSIINKFSRKHDTNHNVINHNKTYNSAVKEVMKLNCNNSKKAEYKGSVKEKRNLRDVYYKAIADAKKLTTIKSHVK